MITTKDIKPIPKYMFAIIFGVFIVKQFKNIKYI